uniref:ABC transporter ATP binding subunit n=2 Tax=Aggregatibacter actinomycetemcomitans TaxID=714 RepID=Q9AQB5_AGGAC|nr:ABC transporter ATP binding subunit [Aggregatibacter actinomycetemcomitans]
MVMMDDIVVNVQNASVCFNKASGNISGLKEYVIKLLKRELMFQEFFALKDINFQVKRGESWGLIGTNGSGKSTLLKLISGIIEPYTGSVEINGSISPLIELGAGFDSELTARENIFLNGALLGYSKNFMEEHFKKIVDFAEVNDFLDVPIKNFSSGMSARLGFAIATATKPNILIVDEVLAVGDYAFQQKCKARMEELLSGGTTLLFVSHSIEQVKTLCQYAVWIDKGIVREQGNVQSVSQKYMSSFN